MSLTKTHLQEVQTYYKGFFIKEDIGNNAFSFKERQQKDIYVAALKYGLIDELSMGEKTVFSEIHEGQEHSKAGLKSFIYSYIQNKHVFVFDNHNHAFFFWAFGFLKGYLNKPMALIHVDQHTDMREPAYYLFLKTGDSESIKKVFEYTNFVLNVGNFIKPAVSLGFFDKVIQVNSEEGFYKESLKDFVLDLDMDIFAPALNYIPEQLKIDRIRTMIEKAKWITVATSPYFMDQGKAIGLIKQIFK